MVRTQIQLEERQYEALRRIAHRKRISLSEAVRQSIEISIGQGTEEPGRPTGARALLDLAAVGKSNLGDLGRAHDRYLDIGKKR
jgi:hypothetical protein